MKVSTVSVKKNEVKRDWHTFDASGIALGRLSSKVAKILAGRTKRDWTPHIDAGDFVIITNAANVVLTGKKAEQKKYYRYSGYPGGIYETKAGKLLAEKPEELFKKAVFGMLPKNKLRNSFMKRLRVYRGATHPHEAQIKGEK